MFIHEQAAKAHGERRAAARMIRLVQERTE
jgi:hypothetical protein